MPNHSGPYGLIVLANNEVGSLQPVAELANRLKGRGIVLHTDASQAVGKVPINWQDLGVDLLTVAGHKARPAADCMQIS